MAFVNAQGVRVDEHGECGATASIPSISREDVHAFMNRLYSLHNNQGISDACWRRESTKIIRYLGQFQSNNLPYPQYAFLTANGNRSGRVALIHQYLNVANQGGSELWNGNAPQTHLLHYSAVTDVFGKVNVYTHRQNIHGVNAVSLTEGIDGFSAVRDVLAQVIPTQQRGQATLVNPRLLPAAAQAIDYNSLGSPLNSVNLNAAAEYAGIGGGGGAFAF